MKPSSQWIVYTVLRLGLFGIVLAVLLALRVEPWIAAVGAAVIGFCVSYLLLRTQRDAVARSFFELRTKGTPDPDAEAENEATEAREDIESTDGGRALRDN